jgi:DHA1 family bicyclomycin/chloramphenicol resistance-like MFS transporter
VSDAHSPARTREQAVGRPLAVVLGLLTVFGPISMDLYLPVLPALTNELHSATSAAQLTVTACLLGLALGQVIAGPISDRFGRRRPLLAGAVAYILTSTLCALSPTIATLVVARFVQGLAGAVGIVIAQAAGRDLHTGGKLVRYYGRLTVIAGLAAIIGPVLGGLAAPLVGLGGAHDAVPLGLVTVVSALLATALYLTTIRRRTSAPTHAIASSQPRTTAASRSS